MSIATMLISYRELILHAEGSHGLKERSGAAQSVKCTTVGIQTMVTLLCSVFRGKAVTQEAQAHIFQINENDPEAVLLALEKLEQQAYRDQKAQDDAADAKKISNGLRSSCHPTSQGPGMQFVRLYHE